MDTKAMLAELNALRVSRGGKPLKSWKASKARLREVLDAVRNAPAPADVSDEHRPAEGLTSVTVAEVARELGIQPKVARAKMRRVEVPAEYLLGKHTYRPEFKSWLVEELRADHRSKKRGSPA